MKFAIAAEAYGQIIGVAIVARPVARLLDDGKTLEVARLCTTGERNACSMLYGACARIADAMGYDRIITYILESEPGTSLRATGWVNEGTAGGGTWSRPNRSREDKHPLERKVRYSRTFNRPSLGAFE